MTTTIAKVPHRLGRGFSLAETMIAIGILGIGMAMAASLFPAALKESQRASSSQLGALICENGLTLAQAVLVPKDLAGAATLIELNSKLQDGRIVIPEGPYRCVYPTGAPDTGVNRAAYGYFLLGKELSAGKAKLVVIAYRKTIPATGTDGVFTVVKIDSLKLIQSNPADPTSPMTTRITSSEAVGTGRLKTGTPVINAATGEYAICISADGKQGELDRVMSSQLDQGAYVMYETVGTEVSLISPAIAVASIEAAL